MKKFLFALLLTALSFTGLSAKERPVPDEPLVVGHIVMGMSRAFPADCTATVVFGVTVMGGWEPYTYRWYVDDVVTELSGDDSGDIFIAIFVVRDEPYKISLLVKDNCGELAISESVITIDFQICPEDYSSPEKRLLRVAYQ